MTGYSNKITASDQEHDDFLDPLPKALWWQALPDGFTRTESGMKRTPCAGPDLVNMLNTHLGGRLWWNDYGQVIVLDDGPIDDSDLGLAYIDLGNRGWNIKKQDAKDAFVRAAKNNRRNTLLEFLNGAEDDPAIEPADVRRLASRYLRPCDAEEQEPTLYDKFMLKMLVGAIERAFNPGCKFDYVVVLQGRQGVRKSEFLKLLFGDPFYGIFSGKLTGADARLLLQKRWVLEIDEIDRYTRGTCVAENKSFLTAAVDIVRVPYGTAHQDFPRASICVGSCNEGAFLKDETGNRRFWVIPVDVDYQINLDMLRREHLGIWKAAMAAWRSGELPYLTEIDEAAANLDVQQFAEESPLMSAIFAFLNRRPGQVWFHKLTVQEHIGRLDLRVNTTQVDRQIKKAMEDLGWREFRPRIDNGSRPKIWCKVGCEEVASNSVKAGEPDLSVPHRETEQE
jgi:predicted P-loop ATPase